MTDSKLDQLPLWPSTSSFRKVLLIAGLSLFAVGCSSSGDDSEPDANKEQQEQAGGEGIKITSAEGTRDATSTMTAANTFWFDDGAKFMSFFSAGWADTSGSGDFGTHSVRLTLFGNAGEVAGAGTYTLVGDPSTTAPMTAYLGITHAKTEQESISGTVVVEVLEGNATATSSSEKLTRAKFTFDGEFAKDGGSETLSGAVRFTRK